jgi:hypothetical protein
MKPGFAGGVNAFFPNRGLCGFKRMLCGGKLKHDVGRLPVVSDHRPQTDVAGWQESANRRAKCAANDQQRRDLNVGNEERIASCARIRNEIG